MSHLSGKYAIVGVGETPVGKLHGRSTMSLHLEAIADALADAGLANHQVDGLLTNQPINDPMRSYAVVVANAAGITRSYLTDLANGGATPVSMAQHAAMAIEAGLCETVVCVHARNMATRAELPDHGSEIRDGYEDYDEPYGFFGAVANHAFIATRHMAQYGTTYEHLAAVAVAARKHARLTPNATRKEPMTIEDHLASRWIAEPLRLLDCSLVSDGGGAFVVTSADRAKDLPNKPVYITAMGAYHPQASVAQADELSTLGGARSSARAYRMAGIGPSDVDFAEIYDCFTITTLVTLEDYGFCAKGEGGPFVENGGIELGGRLPVNTHGGLLSHAHVEGMLHITEAVKQLRGTVEPERQVSHAEIGVVSGHGGVGSMHATLILSSSN
ncbi:MAG: thiolase family protein [Streptosporangiaceae bacterium]